MCLLSVAHLLTESGLERIRPCPHPRGVGHIVFFRVDANKGMKKGWYLFMCETFLGLLCNVCFTVLSGGQLKVLN